MIICSTPGYYELVIDPDYAGLMLATLIAERAENPFWIVSVPMIDDVRAVWGRLDRWPAFAVDHVNVAFGAIQELRPDIDLVVIYDLASLLPDHSASRYIARSVKRAIAGWEPEIPVLVLNQHRHPAPPGGVYWRTRCRSRRLRTLYNEWGLTLAHLEGGDRFVIEYPYIAAQFRALKPVERYLLRGMELRKEIDNRWLIA